MAAGERRRMVARGRVGDCDGDVTAASEMRGENDREVRW
jgi:hypothetical protein